MIATQYAELEDTDFAVQIDRLLDSISRGATVTITKQHQPVARVVAADDDLQTQRWQALREMRESRKQYRLDGLDIRVLREEGRA